MAGRYRGRSLRRRNPPCGILPNRPNTYPANHKPHRFQTGLNRRRRPVGRLPINGLRSWRRVLHAANLRTARPTRSVAAAYGARLNFTAAVRRASSAAEPYPTARNKSCVRLGRKRAGTPHFMMSNFLHSSPIRHRFHGARYVPDRLRTGHNATGFSDRPQAASQ